MGKASARIPARLRRNVSKPGSTQLSSSPASVVGFRPAIGVAGKTYFPRVLDVLAQGGPQLLHYSVEFTLVGNCERLIHQLLDLVFAGHLA